MATQKQKQIQRAIFVNIFWSVVGIGLIFSNSVHGFWLVVTIAWLGMQLTGLYGNSVKYADAGRKAQHETYEKTMNDFHKTMNDWAKRTSQQQYSRQQGQQGYQEGYQQQRQQTVVRPEMSITDAYKLMKLKYSDTPETVKKRYRQLAMLWHPDKFATDTKVKQEAANRNFQKLNTAYNVIKKHKKIA